MHNGDDNPPESHLYDNWFVDVDGQRLDVTDVSISDSMLGPPHTITLTLNRSLPADCSHNEVEVTYRAGAATGAAYGAESKVSVETEYVNEFGNVISTTQRLRSAAMYDLFRYPAANLTTPSTVGSGAKVPCPSDSGPSPSAGRVDR